MIGIAHLAPSMDGLRQLDIKPIANQLINPTQDQA